MTCEPDPSQQTCKVCGRAQNEIDYVAADHDWALIVPEEYRGLAVCLACLRVFAARLGIVVVPVFWVNGP